MSTLAEKIEQARIVIEGIVGLITPIGTALPIIESLLRALPPPVAQEFPPEKIAEIIAGYQAKEDEFDEKFLPPDDEAGDDGNDGGEH